MREAFSRLDPDWVDGHTSTTVLLPRSAPNYRNSIGWVHERLTENDIGAASFAGVDESDLLRVLEDAAAKVRPGSLRDARIYVAASEAARSRLDAAFKPSGARFILLDPAKPVPQRRERLPRADGTLPTAFDFQKSEAAP